MSRREAVARATIVALAAAGVVVLLWSAWRVLTTPLPNSAAAAAWTLWVVSVAALVTFVLYLREVARHGLGVGRASWKPLPGVALLWVAGLTALVAFGFVLPERPADSAQSQVDSAAASPTTPTTPRPTTPRPTTTGTPTSPATSARVKSVAPSTTARATTRPRPVTTASPVRATTRKATPVPSPTSTSPTPSTTTTDPLLDIVLPPGHGRRPTEPPPSR
ncbi:hypothetical protein GCM10025782_20810 [Pedococcus ginsenosidimutans]|uniref:Uncharacterized protein n=1 Tax=Pedococcus ginsenosidimutans TaxID=490570 RepID=A0ABP8Y7M9_9MICO